MQRHGTPDPRPEILDCTERFHHVKKGHWTIDGMEVEYFHCNCRDYFYRRWCFQAALMQHEVSVEILSCVERTDEMSVLCV